MPKWIDTTVMHDGLDEIIENCDEMHLLSSYSQGDTPANVLANSLGSVAMVPGDFSYEGYGSYGQRLVVAAKTINATGSTGLTPDLHVALVLSTGPVILSVTDEISNQPITSGNPVDIPTWGIRVTQPT